MSFARWSRASLTGCVLLACSAPPRATAPKPRREVGVAAVPGSPARAPTPPPRAPGTLELVKELTGSEQIAEAERRWHSAKKLLEAIRALADPRGADALADYVKSAAGWPGDPERVYRRTQAAFALAELGDLRALPILAARLDLDPQEVYREDAPGQAELRRSDQERVIAARLIGDLALINPDALPTLRKEATGHLLRWLDQAPAPHANGLRALARMQTDDPAIRKKLRDWADPAGALPRPGAQPPFEDKWLIAQSASRYLGALRDAQGWGILEKQLGRKAKAVDATMDGMLNHGTALLGMTVRSLALGAADGMAEWGDSRATAKLLAHVDDDKQNEQSRIGACRALGFVADSATEREVSARLAKWSTLPDAAAAVRVRCLLEAVQVHPVAAATPLLLARVVGPGDESARLAFAAALGRSALDAASEAQLVKLVGSASDAQVASVALLLGGSAQAVKAIATGAGNVDAMAAAYEGSLSVLTEQDLRTGRLARWVGNARALAAERRGERALSFAEEALSRHLTSQEFDAGPHTLTRTLLRARLAKLAATGSLAERETAVDTLELARERGVLLALSEGEGPVARRASMAAARLAPEPDGTRPARKDRPSE